MTFRRLLRYPFGWAVTVVLAGVHVAGQAAQPAPQPPRAPRAAAPIDLTGTWVAVINEDWRYRMVIPSRGDYASVPLTDAARAIADAWDPERDKAEGNACKAYGAGNIMRMPTRLQIAWADDRTLRVETDAGKQVRTLVFTGGGPIQVTQQLATGGDDNRPDARRQQAERSENAGGAVQAPRSLQGSSRAEWERSNLKVITQNLLPGYLRRNGVPYGENAVVTEYYYRYAAFGEEWLTVSTVVEDPQYLRLPFLTSSNFKKEADNSRWSPADCVAEWGPLKQMGVDPFL